MATPVIIDIVILAVLVGFLVYGARRGLFRALAGLLIIVVALVAGYGIFVLVRRHRRKGKGGGCCGCSGCSGCAQAARGLDSGKEG